jgi:hypothetical protein
MRTSQGVVRRDYPRRGKTLIVLGCGVLLLGLFAWLEGVALIVMINLVVGPIAILAGIWFLKQAYEPGRKSAGG